MRALLVFIAGAVLALAQNSRFETEVTNIHADVSAIRNGTSLHGLTRDDFIIRDENQPQPILGFDDESTPLDLVLLVDISWDYRFGPNPRDNVRSKMPAVTEAIKAMRPGDRTAVISFGFDPHLEQALTANPNEAAAALQRALSGSDHIELSRRFFAIQWAGLLLQADPKSQAGEGAARRKAIVIVTDDRHETLFPDEPLIRQIWSIDAPLHGIAIPVLWRSTYDATHTQDIPLSRMDNVEHIARATGGEFVTTSQKDPLGALPDLLARIRSSYSIWYRAPQAKPGELRHISVELSPDARKKYPGAQVHAREGYIAQ